MVKTSTCDGDNKFLGGHCKLDEQVLSKTYDNLPKHSTLRITANLHAFDNWTGENIYVLVDGKIEWAKIVNSPKHISSLNHCGRKDPDPFYSLYKSFPNKVPST